MAPAGTHYWDHHKVIKAIEKSSLQATFGPEITSTKNLLPPKKPKKPKKSKAFFGDTVKAKGESPIKPVEEHAQTKRVRSILSVEGKSPINRVKEHAQTKRVRFILPIDQTKEAGNISPNLTPNDGRKHADLTNQRGNIPSEWFTDGRSIPAIWTHENAVASILQGNFLGQVPPDVWGRNVEELRQWTGTQRVYRDIHDLSYSNHKHPNHNRFWNSSNLFCIGCTKETMKKCQICGGYCCLWSRCRDVADTPQAGILPQERVKASQWLKKIASLMSYGIDEPTFLACYRCRRVLCPKCTSICEICDALSCRACCSRCPICQVPKCVRCKPNRQEECSYHKGPPMI